MADYYQGDTIRDYFTEIDINSNKILGDTFVVVQTEDPDMLDFAIDVTEVDPGTYRVEFVATKSGTYYYQIHGISVPNQYFEETFVVSPLLSSGLVSISTAAYGTTLSDLIIDTAGELRDILQVKATQDGSSDGTSFIDEITLAAIPSSSMRGASLVTISPAVSPNYWVERRIVQFDENTQVAVLKPGLPQQSLLNDEAIIINLKSQGYNLTQYRSGINRTISSAFPNHIVPISYLYPNPFVAADGTIVTPTHMTHLWEVMTVDEAGIPMVIPMNPQGIPCSWGWGGNCRGWWYDYTQNAIVVRGSWGVYLEGKQVILKGYGRDAKLTEPTDMTSIIPEWIVLKTAASMKRGQDDKRLLADASQLDNNSDVLYPAMVTQLPPNVLKIR